MTRDDRGSFTLIHRAIAAALVSPEATQTSDTPDGVVAAVLACAWSIADALKVDFTASALSMVRTVEPDKHRVLAIVHALYSTGERPS